ncbi:AAA family ATPase [Vibrio sp. Vb339]|uniref:AAA family ATPase n=1 Tax=Vibrio sp. Vb339 TaxID=1192013 RepID=UPI0015558245|nr:AAA family ATPase [Vibrio sp. Vb339]
MRKIIIMGCSGSGKSTLARKLGGLLDLPVYHLDNLYWKPNWVKPDKSSWLELQDNLLSEPSWIVEGNYQSTIQKRLDACDTVIFLDVNRFSCIYRVIKRRIYQSNRPDLAEGCDDKLDITLLKFIWNYNRNFKKTNLAALNRLPSTKRVFVVKSARELLKQLQ